ncbi:protein Exd1 homolog [Glossina fuscipes]|uniref:Protein Exd1 homolog n=1 Tax=Glossina fuscipes TaxID=7396 RepID=A0A9C5ZKW7_9MUSC|nr:protein Exd1 homolog [Glossina fuscipes]
MHPTYFRIELDNVCDIKTNFNYASAQALAYNDIIDVKFVSNKYDKNVKVDGIKKAANRSNSDKEFVNAGTSNRENTFLLRLSNVELSKLQSQVKDFVYIIQTDKKYHNALADITNQSMIALIIEPVESCRNNKTSVIAIATATNVYIFDILYLGKVFPDFGRILETKYPRKIVHNSHCIVDHLQHRQNVKLSGIFDTFVAYCLVSDDKTHRSLEETIQDTLNMPFTYFVTEETETNPFKPYKRPLTNAWLSSIAKKALLQLKLAEYLLHKQMLKNFYLHCEQISNTYVAK